MSVSHFQKVRIIDSHTGGEPTRTVIDGAPHLGTGPMSDRRDLLQAKYARFMTAVVNEPRGSDVLVGALLLEPSDPACAAAVIFFNNVGCLGMCGHGTIGVVRTLSYLGRIVPGTHGIETPVGTVTVRLDETGEVSVRNVSAFRHAKDIVVAVPGIGTVVGDIAWGGNWFYLVREHGHELNLGKAEELTDFTRRIRQSLAEQGFTGADGQEIDHIELFGPSAHADSRNFVLCPGNAYDRSPCGTGTSAKLACLHAEGKLGVGDVWRQESITGSIFEGSIELVGDLVVPTIKGRAWVTAELTLLLDPDDPLCWGIPHKQAP